MKRIRYTCSLCHHFDGNREKCTLLNKETKAQSAAFAQDCRSNGYFVRDMNVLYSYYNFINENGYIESEYIEDLSKLPKDDDNIPLFVFTKKGMERAIPAYPGLKLRGNKLTGVRSEFTYQGQRELIYELGVELARRRCEALGIELVVLEGEENHQGFEEYKVPYKVWR